MSLNDTALLTPKVVHKTLFLVILIINPSHTSTLISKLIMMTMALQLTLPYRTTKEWKMQSCQMMKITMTTALLHTLTPPQTIVCKLKEWTEWEMKLKKGKLK